MVVRPVDRPQADPIRVAYNKIRHCTDSIPDVFRAGVTQTRSKGLTGNIVEEAMTQTIDAVSGSEYVPSRLGMNKTKQQSWRSDLKESQHDPPEVDEDGICD